MTDIKKVVIRTTTGVELDLEFCENTKIIDLKKEIEKVHPQNPTPDRQRLICAGKQAADDQTVESFVEKSNVVHLVLKNKSSPSHQASTPISQTQNNNNDQRNGNNPSNSAQRAESGVEGQSSEMTAAIEQFLRSKKIQFRQQQEAISDLREFMAYKNMQEHPFLGYSLDPKSDEKAAQNHFSAPAAPQARRQARQIPRNQEPQVANDGQAIEWMDRLFSFIQILVIGGIVFHRTAGGNWLVFFAYFAGLLFLILLFKGFFRPQRREARETNAPQENQQPPGFFRVFLSFVTGFFRSFVPEALPAGAAQ